MSDFSDPAQTVQLLQELERVGFSDEAFAVIHHFSEPERIASPCMELFASIRPRLTEGYLSDATENAA